MQNNLLIQTYKEVRNKYETYFTILLFTLFASFVLISLSNIINIIATKIFQTYNITFDTYIAIRITYLVVAYVIYFLLFSYTNGLLVLNSINKLGFRKNTKIINKNFINFIFLSIFILFIGFLATSPLYAISFVFLSAISVKVLAYSAFMLLFMLFIILFSVWFILTPYIMLEKEINLIKTIKESFKMVRKKEGYILLRNLIAFVLLSLFQIASIYLRQSSSVLAVLLDLALILFIIPFFYSYFYLVYKKIK